MTTCASLSIWWTFSTGAEDVGFDILEACKGGGDIDLSLCSVSLFAMQILGHCEGSIDADDPNQWLPLIIGNLETGMVVVNKQKGIV